MKTITLLELKNQSDKIIKEVGDLENVESYLYDKIVSTKNVAINRFKTDEDWTVNVQIVTLKQSDFDSLKLPSKREDTFNIGYKVEGNESQYAKTTYSKLIRILKTITDIVLDFVESHPNADTLLFLAANKDPEKLLSHTDNQKSALYKTIVIKRLHRLGSDWKIKDVDVNNDPNFTGFVIYKPNNNNETRK
jgi:hypothetical protein